MPQLTPFYFKNEVLVIFITIGGTIYLLSKYTLPRMIRLFLSRIFITKA